MRKLTALKMSHFHRERHSVVVLILLYKIVKKTNKIKEQHQQFVSSVRWRLKTVSWLLDE